MAVYYHGCHVDDVVEDYLTGLLAWEAMGRSIKQMEILLVTFEHDEEFFVAADGSRKLHGRQ